MEDWNATYLEPNAWWLVPNAFYLARMIKCKNRINNTNL